MNPPPADPPLRCFACRIKGHDHETRVHERTPGRAKASYFNHARDCLPDLRYTEIRVRVEGDPISSRDFLRTANYRGVPFARVGMAVEVCGERGVIVGHNSAANFDVLFDAGSRWAGQTLNCHPQSEIVYFDGDGQRIRTCFEESNA